MPSASGYLKVKEEASQWKELWKRGKDSCLKEPIYLTRKK